MTTSTELLALAERCEAAAGPDRELDGDIHFLLFGGLKGIHAHGLKGVARVFNHPEERVGLIVPFSFTGSVEDAERALPSDRAYPEWQLTRRLPTGYHANVGTGADGVGCETPALALVAAALKARAAELGEMQGG